MVVPLEVFFSGLLVLGLVIIYWTVSKSKSKYQLEISSGLTIFLYRLVTYLTIYLYGVNSPSWQRIYSDSWNHYQLGLVILIFVYLFRDKIKNKYFQIPVILGVGIGMILDEISDIIKLLAIVQLPYHFRDSLPDLLLIIFTYLVFLIIRKLIIRDK